MGYVACVQLKVPIIVGGKVVKYEIRQPGQAVPENAFQNPALWVGRGYIRADKNQVVPRGSVGPAGGVRAMTAADMKAREERKKAVANGEIPLRDDENTTAFIPADESNIGPITGALDEEKPEKVEKDEDITVVPGGETPAEAEGLDALLAMSKKELFAMAKKMKVKVDRNANKGEVAEAILAVDVSKG